MNKYKLLFLKTNLKIEKINTNTKFIYILYSIIFNYKIFLKIKINNFVFISK